MRSALLSLALAILSGGMGAAPARRPPPPPPYTIAGDVFIATRGAGAYKFSAVTVTAFPAHTLDGVLTVAADLYRRDPDKPERDGFVSGAFRSAALQQAVKAFQLTGPSATTDSEGRFSLTITDGQPVWLYCHAHRLVGRREEYSIWAVRADAAALLSLSQLNEWKP